MMSEIFFFLLFHFSKHSKGFPVVLCRYCSSLLGVVILVYLSIKYNFNEL